MVWEKIIFPDLVIAASMGWIKQNRRQHRYQAEKQKRLVKNYDTDREEQDTGKVAVLCWELLLYKP